MITFIPLSVPFATNKDTTTATTDAEHGTEKEQPKALAYLLQMDDIRVLIDCGAPEDFIFNQELPRKYQKLIELPTAANETLQQDQEPSPEFLTSGPLDEILESLAPTIDLVLLSHSTLSHLGLYAYAHAKLGLRCLVYATLPVQSMGKLTVQEAIESWQNEIDVEKEAKESQRNDPSPSSALGKKGKGKRSKRCLVSLEELEEAFDEVKTVRYLQPTHLEGKCAGVTLTAYSAGHSLGGAVWKIRSPTSGTVLIALDWNHNRERHLDGTALLATSGSAAPSSGGGASGGSGGGGISDAVRRPDLLITEVQRGMVVNSRRKDRDAALLEIVHKTIQSGNSVFFPVDPSARLLELLVLLDQHWAYAYPHAKFPLCLVSRTGKEVVERARTYMEWMTREWATKSSGANADEEDGKAKAQKKGRGMKNNAPSSPLEFKYLKIFSTIAQMDEAIGTTQAKVVLAVPPSMTHGPSRRLFARFAQNPNDVVIMIQRGQPGSIARWLWDRWQSKQASGVLWKAGKVGSAVAIGEKLKFELKSKVPLEGDELRAHLEAELAEKERQAQQRALLARSRRRLEADEDDESSDSDDSSDDDAGGAFDEMPGVGPNGRVANGGNFAEPGSLTRKKGHTTAFDGSRGGARVGAVEGMGDGVSNEVSFDIYLKGNASRATSFFGAKAGVGGEGPYGVGIRYRMFPMIERKRRIDAYGETIDVGRWLSKKRELEAATAGQDEDEDKDAKRKKLIAEKRKAAAATPSKFITEELEIEISCKVAFIDMEGLNDGRALKTLIPQLHPRRLIMVDADEETRKDMVASISAVKSMTKEIHAPWISVTVKIGELTNAYTVNMGDGLLTSMVMSRFEDYEVGYLRANVKFDDGSTVPTLEPLSAVSTEARIAEIREPSSSSPALKSEGAEAVQPSQTLVTKELKAIPIRKMKSANVEILSPTLFVGDLKLSTLKSSLSSNHRIGSEFAGEGMLVCDTGAMGRGGGSNEAVTVKKESQGRIVVEGNVGKGVRLVRKAVYDLHAKVAGM
ncbi:hypothetical protein IE53DRAFT_389433 [Violaceomyces palustris]|uniref:Uncharacterized protein n=1 Tax=Violaceomyces palustris TaxID=1673888 RepID=A0ACD0NRF3_9BASI|nr:hypothetical protein IE53DRAFT_389433 [Violaceomyces palustris]